MGRRGRGDRPGLDHISGGTTLVNMLIVGSLFIIQPPMPWEMIGTMDDLELAALYAYLRAAP